MVNNITIKKAVLFVAILFIFLLAFLILKNILIAIAVALLLAYIFHPLFKKIKIYAKNSSLSAALMILIIVIIIAIPIVLLAPIAIRQVFGAYVYLQKVDFAQAFVNLFPNLIDGELANVLSANINNVIGKFFTYFLNSFTDLIVNAPNLLLQFAVFLFTFFFAVRDGDKLKQYAYNLSPFSESTEKKFLLEFRHITDAVIYGQVLIGIVQGLALGVGLFILGVPNALVLTILATVVSIIPVLGSWLVWLPVGALLILTGNVFSGGAILLYGMFFVSVIDNILRPVFLSRHSNLPIVVSVIGTIGGLYYFGIIGLVLGPLILAYVLILIDFYKQGKLDELFKK